MKKYVVTGLIILLPLVLTLIIISFLFDLFTTPFVPLVQALLSLLPIHLPPGITLFISRLIGLALLCLLILLLGVIARHFLLKKLIKWTNSIFSRIPFVKTVYKVSREVMSAIFSPDGKQAFKDPVMYPFPYAPYYGIGFSAGEAAKECEEVIGEPLVSIFAPTAPHPISGFLFLIPKKDVKAIDMTKEDAIKFLVSCGVITPETKQSHDSN
jgi:uncharacterized membrane protein